MSKSTAVKVPDLKHKRTQAKPASKKSNSASHPTLGQGHERGIQAKAEYSRLISARLGRQPARHAISLQLRNQIMQRDDFSCVYCGANVASGAELEIDHKVPISRGGTNDPHNLQTLCRACNLGKSNHLF